MVAVMAKLDPVMVVLNPIDWLAQLLSLFVRDQGALPVRFGLDGVCLFPDCDYQMQHAKFSNSSGQSMQVTRAFILP